MSQKRALVKPPTSGSAFLQFVAAALRTESGSSQQPSDFSNDDDMVHVNNDDSAPHHGTPFHQESAHGLGIRSEGEEDEQDYNDDNGHHRQRHHQQLHVPEQGYSKDDTDISEISKFSIGPVRDRKTVAEKLQAAFGYPELEEFIAEYPCWLARSVLLPGYMYLTSNHICFYANLPNSQDVYYPLKTIDLKYALSAEPSIDNDGIFYVFTNSRKYTFRTDADVVRTDWVKAIQKSIFHAKMEGDKVKISIPLAYVIDVEMNTMAFAEAIQIKVMENDESFAVDEYFFAYFNDTAKTLAALKAQVKKFHREGSHGSQLVQRIYDSTSPNVNSAGKHHPSLSLANAAGSQHGSSRVSETSGSKRNSLKLPLSGFKSSSRSPSPARNKSQPTSDTEENEKEKEKSRYALSFSIRGTTSWISELKPDFGGVDEGKEQASFQREFSLPETEGLSAVVSGYLLRILPLYGRIYLSDNYICFKSKLYGTRTKVIVPLADVEHATKHKATRFYFHGLSLLTKTDEEIFLEFSTTETRNTILSTLLDRITPEAQENRRKQRLQSITDTPSVELDDPMGSHTAESLQLREEPVHIEHMSWATHPGFKPSRPMHITCLTIGSRGDVQPYIALCKRLMQDGHTCRISTHAEYKDWVEGHGIEFRVVGGDPGELIELCVENGMFTVSFIRESMKNFRGWLDELMETAWTACQGTDVLIESPSAMAGIHIAEKLDIPYFRAFPFPWTRTRAFPHPFAVPEHNLGRGYNYMTYVMIEQVFWKGISGQINKWRKDTLGLGPTSLEKMDAHSVPCLYSWSPNLVPAPMDWHSWIHVTGYWFLDNPDLKWTPPDDLVEFLKADPNNKPVYIGFGSMVVPDPDGMTRTIIEAVVKSGVRAIISKGWSDRLSTQEDGTSNAPKKSEEIVMPPSVLVLKSVPHDWLFPQLAGCVHHGGAGTAAAGLRAGIPTVIKPFFGDQYFWGQRLEEAGVGVWCRELTVKTLTASLVTITTDQKMIKRAKAMGEKIRLEDGVGNAVQYLYHDLLLAKQRLNKMRKEKSEDTPVKFSVQKDEDEDDWWLVQPSSGASGATSGNEGSESTGGLNVISGSEEDSMTPLDDAPSVGLPELVHSRSHQDTRAKGEPLSPHIHTSSTDPGPDRATEMVSHSDASAEDLAGQLEALQMLGNSRSPGAHLSKGETTGKDKSSAPSTFTSKAAKRTSAARNLFDTLTTKATNITNKATSMTGYFNPHQGGSSSTQPSPRTSLDGRPGHSGSSEHGNPFGEQHHDAGSSSSTSSSTSTVTAKTPTPSKSPRVFTTDNSGSTEPSKQVTNLTTTHHLR
ncbi:Sterol 3-beta-glucosyltransferase [Podila epigama]|nr:Sterol 3-beta-glucosyltransferase [Podila epigama]